MLLSQLHLHLLYFFLFRLGRNHSTRSPFPAYIGTLYGQDSVAPLWREDRSSRRDALVLPPMLVHSPKEHNVLPVSYHHPEISLANSSLLKDVVMLRMPLIPTFLSLQYWCLCGK